MINQSRGNDFLAPYRELYPHILLRDLPELEELQTMINGLPLEFVSFQSDSSAYLAALEVQLWLVMICEFLFRLLICFLPYALHEHV